MLKIISKKGCAEEENKKWFAPNNDVRDKKSIDINFSNDSLRDDTSGFGHQGFLNVVLNYHHSSTDVNDSEKWHSSKQSILMKTFRGHVPITRKVISELVNEAKETIKNMSAKSFSGRVPENFYRDIPIQEAFVRAKNMVLDDTSPWLVIHNHV